MIINNVKFLGSRIIPNPLEVDYWIDTKSDPYGSIIKYYNGTEWVLLNNAVGAIDLSFYYTKNEVDSRLNAKADSLQVYTKEEVDKLVSGGGLDPSKYYTKVEIDNKGFLTSIPAAYVTESELDAKGYLTKHQDISHLASISYVDTKVANLINGAPQTLDTLKEIADAIKTNESVVQVLDAAIGTKANKTDVYTKTEIDNLIDNVEVDLSNYYDKNETNTLLTEYAKTDDVYDKATVDKKLADAVTGGTIDLNNYYTKQETYSKTEINAKIPDVSNFITAEDLPTVPTKTSDLTNDSGYITLEEVPITDLNGYVTDAELSEYTYDKETIDQKISNADVDLTDYYTKSEVYNKTEVNDLLSNIDIPEGTSTEEIVISDTEPTGDVDMWIDTSETTDSVITIEDAPADGKVYGRQNNSWTEVVSEEPDLSNYYTKGEVNGLIPTDYLTEIPAEYITETELDEKGYLTQHQDISNLASKTEVSNAQVAAQQYVDAAVAALVNGAPEALNTLDELAEALQDNADIVDVLNESISTKLSKDEASANYLLKTTAESEYLSKVDAVENYAMKEELPDTSVFLTAEDSDLYISNISTNFVEEAPMDGGMYVRQNGAWVKITL